jgi:Domain of unknown function (DUF4864)
MEEPLNNPPEPEIPGEDSPPPEPVAPPVWQPRYEQERLRRRTLLRRLTALLGTGTVAFTLTTWLLLRRPADSSAPRVAAASPQIAGRGPAREAAPDAPGAAAAALRIARAQLIALNGDDIGGAYSYFTPRYRNRVSLALFRRSVQAHREMFHTDEQEVKTISESEDRVLVDIHVSSDDDEDYVAHYTLVRINGRWAVDDLRWALDQDDQGRSSA